MLELGIDEITLVLQLSPSQKECVTVSTWQRKAHELIFAFEHKANLINVLGKRMPLDNKPLGYTNAYAYGEHAFNFAVAYHEVRIDMGVVVKFSAQAFEFYLQRIGKQVYQFMQSIEDEIYSLRLSRIDLVADFIDESVDTTNLYRQLVSGEVAVATRYINKKTGAYGYRKSSMTLQGFAVGEDMPTIYLGSAKSDAQMRIYDKKLEQIKRTGAKFDRAIACDNWTRFEAVYRNEYAHQLTDGILSIKSDEEMSAFVASNIIQKYRLMNVEDGALIDDIKATLMLLEVANGLESCLRSPESRTFDIVRNIGHMVNGSGTFPTLYKICSIWGSDALEYMVRFIEDEVKTWQPNVDCAYWLRNYQADTLAAHPDFIQLVEDYVKPMLEISNREGANDGNR